MIEDAMSSRVTSGGSMVSGNSTDFGHIEADKENIQPLKQGRSASGLTKALSLNKETRKEVLSRDRDQLEASIEAAALDDLDDPLEPYLKYLEWIHTHFPSGGSTESGLIQLLERITHDFRDDQYYKNDIRYFRVWLEYVKFSDNPRDIFQYLLKKKIGMGLALFYESYANFMELEGDFKKAEELYQMGLDSQARPMGRLTRSFENFKIRKQQSAAGPQKRQGLGALNNPSGGGLGTTRTASSRPSSKSFAVFNDAEAGSSLASAGIWSHLDTIGNSKKENVIRPTSWSGEKLIQQKVPLANKTSFEVFNDKDARFPVTKIIKNPGKRTEKFDFNFDLLYSDDGEKSLMEVLLLSRGVYYSAKKRKAEAKPLTPFKKHTITLENDNETKLLNSPTLTYFSKESMKEVYQMINQPLTESKPLVDENPLDEGLSDFVTETIEHHKPVTPQKLVTEDTGMMSSPFVEEPVHSTLATADVLINPFDTKLQRNLLAKMQHQLSNDTKFHFSGSNAHKLDTLKSLLKPRGAPIMGNRHLMMNFEDETFCFTKQLDDSRKLGVYLSEKSDGTQVAVKVNSPPTEWEFYVLLQLQKKSNSDFVQPLGFYKFEDESYMILPYYKHGTVKDLAALGSSTTLKIDESVSIYLSVQVLRQMLKMHACGMVHGNLKPENCVLTFTPQSKPSFQELKLIDFERSIDLSLFPENVRFSAQLEDDLFPAVCNWDAWRYEPDYYGAANVLHTILFGHQLDLVSIGPNTWGFRETVRKYWQKETWDEIFHVLLNSHKYENIELKLKSLTGKLESWVALNWGSCGLARQLAKISDFFEDQRKRNKI
ncbi:hypothetical protein OGAPHI_000473 [Ogataea philodendri]|uniref:Uncharacterized protein n=1 Tax=Ogataea philodendri TaxID=1378263 RepID=A0A9P8PGM6_9ASCO|nr:uncharacterized protein OGAPHI_000473 [Ogataea philodendri]KAH3671250.1 hypothetical protein OGAPHI_000473 [Ogataea philodendri]